MDDNPEPQGKPTGASAMTHEEFRRVFNYNDPPLVIQTKSGQSYRVESRANLWIPGCYEGMFCITVPEKGLIVLRQSSIESIQIEHGRRYEI